MVVLALALSRLLVTIWIEALVDIALTRATHRVPPPVGWARLLGLPLTIFAAEQRGVTLTRVPVVSGGVTCTRGVALARVQVTHVVAAVAHVASLTLTHVLVPGLVTRGVSGTRVT